MLNITTNILLLSKSIRIKFDILARHINKQLTDTYSIEISDDKTEWKYYQNLCGIKHFSNSDVKIKIIETNEVVSLTKEVLEEYRYTRNELLKNESLYIELVNTYPSDIDYIVGCLYPSTMDYILSSTDGTILTYNKTLVEDNENVIMELEKYIKNILARWHIDGYAIVEDLYLPSLLNVLYSNIPNKILNIRLNNIKTSRVHSFFLQEFFNSRLLLWNDVKYLNKPSIYWLYHNLDYLIKHVGKTETLYKIVEKVFEANKVGIGTYQLHQTTPDVNTDSVINELPYDINRSKIVTKALNNSYVANKDEEISISKVTNLQLLETDPLKGLVDNQLEKTEYITKNILELLTNSDKGVENTKILDIHTKDLFKINSDAMLDLVINNLFHMISEDKYNGLIDYSDPNTNNSSSEPKMGTIVEYTEPNSSQTYTLTPFSGMLMLTALLLKLVGREDEPISYITYYNVIDDDLPIDTHLSHLFPDGYSEKILRYLDTLIPAKIDTIHTPNDMKDYINQIVLFSKVSWILDSNCENNIVSANIKHYLERITRNRKVILSDTPKTIQTLLNEQGIEYNIKNSYDIVSSISELLYAFTDIKVDEYEELRLSLNAYKNIINKLTSYTTQVIDNVDDVNNKIMLYNNNPSVLYSKLGLLTILDAYFQPLEDFIGILNLELDDFRDETTLTFCNTDTPFVYLRREEDIVGNTYIYDDKFIRDDKPTNYIDIMDKPMYNILYEEFKDVFFKDVKALNYPLEDFTGESNFAIDDMRDEVYSEFSSSANNQTNIRKEDIVQGKAIITTGNGLVEDKPNISIDLIDIPDYDITADEYKDTFFKNVVSEISPLENNELLTRTETSDISNKLIGDMSPDTTSSYIKSENDITGKVIVNTGSGVITDKPVTNIDIHSKPEYDITLEEFKDIFFTNVQTETSTDSTDISPINLSTGTVQIITNEPVITTSETTSQEVETDSELTEITGEGQVYSTYTEDDKPTNTITIEEIEE